VFLVLLPDELGRALLSYLGLWRPDRRALGFERALRIAREALALHQDQAVLAAALAETVEALRAKRDAGDIRPLETHGYLRRVIESVAARVASGEASLPRVARPVRRSATIEALERLQRLKDGASG
jgi:hypothetical protein